jgi:Uma2 family endonuclease
MRTLQTDIRAAVDRLPEASVLVLDGIGREEFERIGEALGERPGIRITYDRGRLEILTPSPAHEKWKEFILALVRELCQERGWHLESYGGMTLASARLDRAVEPDTCFYVSNAERMIGKDVIDVEADPPDVVVEVDRARQSRRKFPIYAAFGVPEIWRVDIRGQRIEIFERRGDDYVESGASRVFPILTGDVLMRFVGESQTYGQTPALAAFRRWVQMQTR